MDLSRLSLGERIAGLSGAALFVFTFVPWLEGKTAWQYFSIVDVVIALIALLAVALPLLKAAGTGPRGATSSALILSRAGLVALAITVAFLLEESPRDVGIFLAVLASAGILYGALTTPEEGAERRRPRARGERPRRTYTEEDFEEPPPGMEDWRASTRSWGTDDFETDEHPPRVGEASAGSSGLTETAFGGGPERGGSERGASDRHRLGRDDFGFGGSGDEGPGFGESSSGGESSNAEEARPRRREDAPPGAP